MKKTIAPLLLSLVLFLTLAMNTQAKVKADETEASPSAEETTQNLKDRIEKVVQEKQEQIKGVIDKMSKNKRGFIGEIQRVSEETLTIKTNKGSEIITLNEDLTLVKSGKTISVDTIAVGDWAIVMGYIEDDAFSPRRIVVSENTLRPKTHQVYLGSIETIGKSELTLLPRNGEPAVNIDIDKNTKYQDLNGTKITSSDISKQTQVLIVTTEDDDSKTALVIKSLAVSHSDEE